MNRAHQNIFLKKLHGFRKHIGLGLAICLIFMCSAYYSPVSDAMTLNDERKDYEDEKSKA